MEEVEDVCSRASAQGEAASQSGWISSQS
jgi:hypothetical protein